MTTQCWPVVAIIDEYILPTTQPSGQHPHQSIRMARGERRAISFCVHDKKPLERLAVRGEWVSVSDDSIIYTDDNVMPRIDIHHVARWWRTRKPLWGRPPWIIPDLLVKDPMFVVAGEDEWDNQFTTNCYDAETLQPVDLPADYTHQYWVDIDVPVDCEAEKFRFKLTLTANGRGSEIVLVDIEVLPFTLPEPSLDYGVYYRGQLLPGEMPQLSSETKTDLQYRQDLRNMKVHGIKHPSLYTRSIDNPLAADDAIRAIKVRREEGVCRDPLLWTGLVASGPWWDNPLPRILALSKAISGIRCNIKDIYAYGSDECNGPAVTLQSEWWPVVQALGMKVQAAAHDIQLFYESTVGAGKGQADLVNINDDPDTIDPQWVRKFQEAGARVWYYTATSPETPATFRKRFGLQAMSLGFDGCMPYAYQHGRENIWTEQDGDDRPDICFAYPAWTGPINTMAFEGFSAGVMDVRYATLLKSLGGPMPPHTGNLDLMRESMQDEILHRLYFETHN